MKKITKNLLTLTAFTALALSTGLGIGANAIAKAQDAQTTVTVDFSDFTLNEKASVRKISPNGIRFQAIVGEKSRASLANATDVTFGMLIAPTLGADEKLTLEDVADDNVKARNLVTQVWTDKATSFATTTTYTYNAAIVGESIDKDFPTDKYATPLNAVGYVQYTDSEGVKTVYTTNGATRSLVQSASLALANGESDDDGVLADIVDTVVPDALSVAAVDAMQYGDTTTLTADGALGYAVVWSSGNPKVATVDKLTGEVTAVGIGTAEITATLGSRTATTTVSVQDKTGVISAAQIATINSYFTLVQDAEKGAVATTTLDGSIPANIYTLYRGEQYKYLGGYDYLEFTAKVDVADATASNVRNTYFYWNRDYIRESDGTNLQMHEIAEWKTARFYGYDADTTANANAFSDIANNGKIDIRIVATLQDNYLSAPIYIASIVGGYSDFEAPNGTTMDLTAKYAGIKSATITPTGSTQAQAIDDLTAWTPVEGTLSFTVGQTGWFDNSYTVNVTVADPVGTLSARTIALKGTTSTSGVDAQNTSVTLEDDATYGKVAVWETAIAGNSWANLTITNESYADFANYDYIDFVVKVVRKNEITNNVLIYPNKIEYANENTTNNVFGISKATEWTTVTFAKTCNKGTAIFNAFASDNAVTLSLKNNNNYTGDYQTRQELTVYIAKIQMRKAAEA